VAHVLQLVVESFFGGSQHLGRIQHKVFQSLVTRRRLQWRTFVRPARNRASLVTVKEVIEPEMTPRDPCL
jgi:hypothetical protein